MEKYGTYRIYKNKKTGEIQRLSEAELKKKIWKKPQNSMKTGKS